MSILGNRRNKGSRVFQGKFGETWSSVDGLDDAAADGLGFRRESGDTWNTFMRCAAHASSRPLVSQTPC